MRVAELENLDGDKTT